MVKNILCVAVALLFPLALRSETGHNNLFAGTWKLNTSRSTFTPGPALQGETVTIPAGDGKVEIQQVLPDGKESNWSFTPSNGVAANVDGGGGGTVTEKRVSARITDHTWKQPNMNAKGHGVLSKDGKSFTYTMTGKNGQGTAVHNVMFFEKQ